MFRVIVAGGRDFRDYEMLKSRLDKLLARYDPQDLAIVCGEAKGADSLGKRYAMERGIALVSYPAEWDKYGKAAGFVRNTQMAENADALIAFWDGKSRGTKHMIETAQKAGLKIRIIHYESEE